jgi:hypothetical protein
MTGACKPTAHDRTRPTADRRGGGGGAHIHRALTAWRTQRVGTAAGRRRHHRSARGDPLPRARRDHDLALVSCRRDVDLQRRRPAVAPRQVQRAAGRALPSERRCRKCVSPAARRCRGHSGARPPQNGPTAMRFMRRRFLPRAPVVALLLPRLSITGSSPARQKKSVAVDDRHATPTTARVFPRYGETGSGECVGSSRRDENVPLIVECPRGEFGQEALPE